MSASIYEREFMQGCGGEDLQERAHLKDLGIDGSVKMDLIGIRGMRTGKESVAGFCVLQ
jgi:hypothetical protein